MNIKREFEFKFEYVSCLYCACNYSAAAALKGVNNPVFCQVFSFDVDPKEVEKNEEKAKNCKSWIPMGMDRAKTILPDVKRWYEDEV